MKYFAAVLYRKEHVKLIKHVKSFLDPKWKMLAHHCTIQFNIDSTTKFEKFLNKDIELVISGIAYDENVVAVKVANLKIPNKVAHITVAVNRLNNATPVMSNNLDWKAVEPIKKIKLKALYTVVENKEFMFAEDYLLLK